MLLLTILLLAVCQASARKQLVCQEIDVPDNVSPTVPAVTTAAPQQGGAGVGKYNIDPNSVTVSGLSSGGAMAAQLHVAFSSVFKGAGIIAGPPYNCANGALTTATTTCMSGVLGTINVATLQSKVASQETSGFIDKTSNMANHRVYIFAGTADYTVKNTVTQKNEEFYAKYLPKSNIKGVFNMAAAHAMVTDNYGTGCGVGGSPYIVNCDYNSAHDMLSFIYNENFVKPETSYKPTGDFLLIDQTPFFPSGSASSITMDNQGYLYVPLNCKNKTAKCKLHVALHGCQQYKAKIGDVYAKNAGYNQVADLNNLVILYPQAKNSALSNPNGCWDWWGYTSVNDYINKKGVQMAAIKNMIDGLLA